MVGGTKLSVISITANANGVIPASGLLCYPDSADVAQLTLTVDDGSPKTKTEVLKQTGIFETTQNVQLTIDNEVFIALEDIETSSFK